MQLSITGLGVLTSCGIGARALADAVAQPQPIHLRPLQTPLSFVAQAFLAEVGCCMKFGYFGDVGRGEIGLHHGFCQSTNLEFDNRQR